MNIVVFPNAKINIGLRVLRKRSDGYHDIETLFFPVALSDILEIAESDTFVMRKYGRPYPDGNDLCVAAYNLLKKDFDLPPVSIDLYKNIPSGAGLGGGSSNAAFTLRALNTLLKLELSNEKLAAYAAMLGSDCPFFIYDRPMYGQGRGEILSSFDAPWVKELLPSGDARYEVRLITPDVSISTAEAYRGVRPYESELSLAEGLKTLPIEEWEGHIVNDFEESVFAAHPELAAEKEKLYEQGAVYAAMSGSGSTLFGIFKK